VQEEHPKICPQLKGAVTPLHKPLSLWRKSNVNGDAVPTGTYSYS
jgi:hypothetical protein